MEVIKTVRKGRIIKTTICVVALSFSLSLGVNAKAKAIFSDIGLAGITPSYDKYIELTKEEGTGDAEKLLHSLEKQRGTAKTMTEVVSPYANLGISIANDYVNIRSEANTESEIVGKLYRGCATDIIEYVDDWVKIESGNVKGYIKAEYLAIGTEAEALVEEFADKYATITTETLFVREEQSTESRITTMVPLGETFYINKEYDEWAEIMIDQDETGQEVSGFVSKDYIDIEVRFKYAISIEEEQAKLAAEEAARLAEIERLEKLAKEQEEARKAAAAQQAQNSSSSNSSSSSSSSSNSSSSNSSSSNSSSSNGSSSNGSSSSTSKSGQEVANYAVKFVGNPYVWGGTSLTNGADCSGFVQSIYAHFGYSIARTSADQANSAGRVVSISNIQPGDLIFYSNGSRVNHVALYIGNGKVVHASNAREGIKISSYNYRTPYKVRRIL